MLDDVDDVLCSAVKRIQDDVTVYHAMAPARLSVTPRYISGLQQAQSLLLSKQTVDGLYLPVFRYSAAVDFIQQAVQTGSAQHLMLKFS